MSFEKFRLSTKTKTNQTFSMADPENCDCLDKWQYLCAAAFQKRDGLSLIAKYRKRKKSEELVANEVTSNLYLNFSVLKIQL